jgi:hypothetical protein
MSTHRSRAAYDETTRGMVAYGVAGFAGVMLITVSGFLVLEGIAAIAKDSVFVKGLNYTFAFDVTTWGWIHLALGVIGIATGIAVLARRTVGYQLGLGISFLITLTSFAFLPYYPVWSLLIVAFNVFVMWALCSEIANDRVEAATYAPAEVPTHVAEDPGAARAPSAQ